MTAGLWAAAAVGGALGAVGRYAVSRAAGAALGDASAWGTLFVNVAGSAAMGLLVAWLARGGGGEGARAFLAVGVLGGFTTFSTFALDAVTLATERSLAVAGVYAAASVGLSVLGLLAGLAAGRALL
ncbi:MAG: CrcB family protein [Pseudomonadota bacterium]